MRVIICKPFFFFVFRTQKGGRDPSRSLQRLWKLVLRIVTTFIVCKWDLWWACGLFSVMIEVKHVVDHVLAFSCLHFINTWDINDLTFNYWKQLQLLIWHWYVCVVDVFIRVALYLTVAHSTSQQMETTCLQIELVYLFLKFSSLEMCIYFACWLFHWCFLDVIDLQGLNLSLVIFNAFDCGVLLEITALLPRHHWKFSL